MAAWLKEVIVGAGATNGKACEVRSAGASTAAQANLDISRILKAADWQGVSTFRKHYFRPQKLQAISNILKISTNVES